ncbi:MAG: xylulokinase, partial [Christensenellaceae bacterium]|nr:xylulokinase [Christensenellaceae bacterium]
IEKTRVCGGGAKSMLWKKILANTLGIEVEWTAADEGPGYGAAILAAVGCGEYESVQAAAEKIVKEVGSVKPDAELTALYGKKYRVFTSLYPSLKNAFALMAENR